MLHQRRRVKDSVPETGFGDRAQTDHGAAGGDLFQLVRIHMRRVDEAPLLIDRRILEQPLDRSQSRPGETVVDFPRLLCNVYVFRQAASQLDDPAELLCRDGAQTMRRDAEPCAGKTVERLAAGFDDAGEAVRVADEAALPFRRCRSPESRVGIERRQQCQTDSGVRSGRDEAPRQLAGIGKGNARLVVMHVVEFTHMRKS